MSTNGRKNRFYEETLPEGYREELVVDAGGSELGSKLKTATVLTDAVLFGIAFFVYIKPRMDEITAGFSALKCVGFIAAYFLYIIMHELTHGIVYKLLTKQKLTFGFKLPVAYCGVPGIYAYRITAMLSLLAPLTLFSFIFAAAFFIFHDPFTRTLVLGLFVLHLSGCIGDLYNIGLYLSRFKKATVLRQDTGPKQIYCTKD